MPTSADLTRGQANPDVPPIGGGAVQQHRLLAILARASTPQERLRQPWLQPIDPELGARRFDRWVDVVADGDAARAARVLADRGLTVDEWRTALGGVRPVPTATHEVPDWVGAALELHRMLIRYPRRGDDEREAGAPRLGDVTGPGLPTWVDPDQPWQFYPGFRAWLDAAAGAVAEWIAAAAAPVTALAQRELTLALATRMLPVVGPQLMAEVQRRALASEPPLFSGDPAADWQHLWDHFPVMARLQATGWRQWRAATAELLTRIGADLPTLAPGATVVSVSTAAGDQHADGRGVAALRLDDGTRWFLKPRSAGPTPVVAAFYAAVDTGGTEPLGLTLPECHARDGYTWVREVPPGECRDVGEVAAYFTRAGAALRVLQALGATDLHHENFIATASQPVLVDLETAVGPGGGWRAMAAPTDQPPDTPTATSMVTSPVDGPPGTASADIGALAGPSVRPTPYEVAALVRTDGGPRLRRERLPLTTGEALPRLAGARVPVTEHTGDVIAGYLAAQHRLAALADPAALLAGAAPDADVRFVARPTQVYARLGQQGLAAEALADAVARELVLERLWRAHGSCPAALIEAEQVALRDLDVPLFTVPLSGTDLVTDRGTRIPAALSASPADEARRRLLRLRGRATDEAAATPTDDGADDLRAALFAVVASPDHTRPASRTPPARAALSEPVATLLTLAHQQPDGTVAWLGLDYDPTRHRWHHDRLGPGLLGEAGIGLALVAADVFGQLPEPTGDDAGNDPASALRIGTQTLLASAARLARLRLGWAGADAFTGPAGTLYALARAATLTGDPRLAEACDEAVAAVLAAADHPAVGPAIDPVAGGLLALAWMPPSRLRDNAVDRLTHLLAADPLRPSRDDDVPDPWARSLPSTFAGRLLAAHRWGLDPVRGRLLGPVRAAATAEAWRPAEAAVLCLLGEPLATAQWHHEWLPRATSNHRLADCVHLAALHTRCAMDPAWSAATHTGRTTLTAHARRNGRWFGDVLAPDTRNLSAVHGLAAIPLLGIVDNPAAPDARTFG